MQIQILITAANHYFLYDNYSEKQFSNYNAYKLFEVVFI